MNDFGDSLVERIKEFGWSYAEYPIRDEHPYNALLIGWRVVASNGNKTIEKTASYRSIARRDIFKSVFGQIALDEIEKDECTTSSK